MPERGVVRILSIDGGGIRGIIPALILAELERVSGRPACELFDLIAGTSTGGIIALGVTVPARAGDGSAAGPRWSAQQLADMYAQDGQQIFHRSLLRRIETADGILIERYAATGLEGVLADRLGDTQLSQALTDVLITSYDVQRHEPFFFKSFTPRPRAVRGSRAQRAPAGEPIEPAQPQPDYAMTLVGRATSAAPTYFEPERAPAPAAGREPDYALVDGGTFANNPAMCAYAEALRNHPETDVLVVSLGTGRLTESISYERAKHWGLAQWARPLFGVMMDGSSAAIDYQLDELLGFDRGHFRFQVVLDGVSDSLDDADPTNIAGLRDLAAASIAANAGRIERVCARLTDG